jgi:hypothetical protein
MEMNSFSDAKRFCVIVISLLGLLIPVYALFSVKESVRKRLTKNAINLLNILFPPLFASKTRAGYYPILPKSCVKKLKTHLKIAMITAQKLSVLRAKKSLTLG